MPVPKVLDWQDRVQIRQPQRIRIVGGNPQATRHQDQEGSQQHEMQHCGSVVCTWPAPKCHPKPSCIWTLPWMERLSFDATSSRGRSPRSHVQAPRLTSFLGDECEINETIPYDLPA